MSEAKAKVKVGEQVFYRGGPDDPFAGAEPLVAFVASVDGDRANLVVFDAGGNHHAVAGVPAGDVDLTVGPCCFPASQHAAAQRAEARADAKAEAEEEAEAKKAARQHHK